MRCLIRGTGRHRRALDRGDVVQIQVQPAIFRADELEARVGLLDQPLAVRLTDAAQPDLEDLERHLAQTEQVLIAVDALLHVDLRDRVESGTLQRVDEQAGLDAVIVEERQVLEEAAASALLACEWLQQTGELREEQVEQRPADELGDAAAARGLQLATDAQWSLVEGLHEL